MKRKAVVILLILIAAAGCKKNTQTEKVKVTVTIFPLLDFVREVGRDRVDVDMLVPPGVQPHSFEPRPADIIRLGESRLFVFIGEAMEPWAEDILKSMGKDAPATLNASDGVKLINRSGDDGHVHKGRSDKSPAHYDPHIWLDFSIDQAIVRRIAEMLSESDPSNEAFYRENARIYSERLERLDESFKKALSTCRNRTILHGGHFAFRYLAERYNLSYMSPYRGFSSEAEPSPGDLAAIIDRVRETGAEYIFYEELLEPKLARIIASETSVKLLKLHAAHNVSPEEMKAGASFIGLMQENLSVLKKALECNE